MDIKIGIKHSTRELSFDTSASAKELEASVSQALESGAKLLSLTDSKGNVFLVPTESVSYLEIGAEEARRVGFIA
jgi:DNA-binding MurR/RpiR family transcriptional regulator